MQAHTAGQNEVVTGLLYVQIAQHLLFAILNVVLALMTVAVAERLASTAAIDSSSNSGTSKMLDSSAMAALLSNVPTTQR